MKRLFGVALAVAGATIGISLGLLLTGGSTMQIIPYPGEYRLVPATRYVPRVPPGAGPCHGKSVRFWSAGGQGVNSSLDLYYFWVRNRGSRVCWLEGRPGIQVPQHSPVPIGIWDSTAAGGTGAFPSGPPGFPREGARFGLAPGQAAHAMIAAFGLCEDYRGAYRAQVNVPLTASLGKSRVSFDVSSCKRTLYVGPWSPPPQPVRRKTHWPLKVALELPARVFNGPKDDEHIDYRVRITNTGPKPFRFPAGSCPEYATYINGSGSDEDNLNCHVMRPLASGASVVFQLHEDLVVDEPLSAGRKTYVWVLHDGTPRGIRARGRFLLTE